VERTEAALAERKQVQAEKNRAAEQEQSRVSTSEPEARWTRRSPPIPPRK